MTGEGAGKLEATMAGAGAASVEKTESREGASARTGISEAGRSEFAKLLASGREQPTVVTGREQPTLTTGREQPTLATATVAGAGTKQARAGEEPPATASLNPKTLQSASSMKAASMIAGLQPWSKDWVFTGREEATPDLKTVFSNSNPAGEPASDAGLRDMLREVLSAEAGMKGVSAQATMNAQAVQAGASGARIGRSESMVAGARSVSAMDGTPGVATEGMAPEAGDIGIDSESLRGLAPGGEFRMEMPVREGAGAQPAANAYGGGTSGMSGAEFMATLAAARGGSREAGNESGNGDMAQNRGLRVIEGGKGATGPNGSGAISQRGKGGVKTIGGQGDEFLSISPLGGAQNPAQNAAIKPAPVLVTGHVTQGAMSRERLSSHALTGLSSEIRNLGQQGGGEIRIRLKPENLGELHLKVVTRGNEVGLRIQASDDHAKKIIEESMGYLRESLSSNQLSLARVEVTVAQAASSAFGADNGGFSQSNSQGQHYQGSQGFDSQMQSSFGNGQQQSGANLGQGRDGWSSDERDSRLGAVGQGRRSTPAPAQVAGSVGGAARWTAGGAGGSSRLNVMA